MKLYLLVAVVMVMICLGKSKNAKNTNEIHSSVVCKKEQFIRKFVNNSRWLNEQQFAKYQSVCKKNRTSQCESGDLYIMYAEKKNTKQHWWVVVARNLLKGRGVENEKAKILKKYVNFDRNLKFRDGMMFVEKVEAERKYRFFLYTIPYGGKVTVELQAPNECENQILGNERLVTTKSCRGKLDFRERHKVAKTVCNLFPDDKPKRTKFIRENVAVTDDCNFVVNQLPPPQVQTRKISTLTTALIIGFTTISFVVVTVLSVYCCLRQRMADMNIRITSTSPFHLKYVPRCKYDEMVDLKNKTCGEKDFYK